MNHLRLSGSGWQICFSYCNINGILQVAFLRISFTIHHLIFLFKNSLFGHYLFQLEVGTSQLKVVGTLACPELKEGSEDVIFEEQAYLLFFWLIQLRGFRLRFEEVLTNAVKLNSLVIAYWPGSQQLQVTSQQFMRAQWPLSLLVDKASKRLAA